MLTECSRMLFTFSDITHFDSLPQGQPKAQRGPRRVVTIEERELFGRCLNHGNVGGCPKQIPSGVHLGR